MVEQLFLTILCMICMYIEWVRLVQLWRFSGLGSEDPVSISAKDCASFIVVSKDFITQFCVFWSLKYRRFPGFPSNINQLLVYHVK